MKRRVTLSLFLLLIGSLIALTAAFGASCTPIPAATTTTTQIQTSNAEIEALQAQVASINSSIKDLPSTGNLNSAISTALGPLNSRVAALEATLNTLNTQVATLSTQAKNIPNDEASIAALNSQLAALNTSVAAIQTTLTGLTAAEAADAASIKVLQSTTTSTTITTTTPTVIGPPVTATILGNVFTGTPAINFPAFAAAGSVTQSISYSIMNATGKTLTGIQLAIGLESVDTNNLPIIYPTGITVTLASSNLFFVWNSQSTGLNYLLGWTNAASSGFLGQLNAFSQPPGIVTYSLAVTVTATGAAPALNLIPVIQVINHTP